MATILLIETSQTTCSAAIACNGIVAESKTTLEPMLHATVLAAHIKEISARYTLDAVAISAGPGSYTGLRIGCSTAKGICYSLNIPLIAINTLELIAHQAAENIALASAIIIPMIDARRMEVYCAEYRKGNDLITAIAPAEARILDANSFEQQINTMPTFFVGDGSAKFKSIASPNAHFIDDITPLAAEMATLAERNYVEKQFVDTAYYEPFYLKEFQAIKSTKNTLK